MSTKKIIIVGLIAYALLSNSNTSASTSERFFILPNGQRVRESLLPQYGYVYFQGQWVSAASLNQYTQQQNTQSFWQNLANNGGDIINAGANLWDIIQDMFNNSNGDWDDTILIPDTGGNEGEGWV